MYVQSVSFERVKGFQKLHFDFRRPDGGYAGWTVFVGGNASGKSTLLKGIALALMGPDDGRQLMGATSGWIQGNGRSAAVKLSLIRDARHDYILMGLTNWNEHSTLFIEPFDVGVRWVSDKDADIPAFRSLDVKANDRSHTPERGLWNPNSKGWFSAGYGPMRRLSGSSSESSRLSVGSGVQSRFVTLFREDAALSESEEWLRTNYSRSLEPQRKDADDIKDLLDGTKALLNDDLLPHGMKVSSITVDHVFIKDARGVELPMRDISDGCRSIYATILDLVHGMYEVYGIKGLFKKDGDGIIVDRPGVVLIDEIEAHLHPAWQRDIPEWLKRHFPLVQFLVTTHSPLIAQAADPNGIFVLPSQTDLDRKPRPLNPDEYEKLRMGRAEKTLLGAAFGLKSVRSRWANEQIERWKLLNAKTKAGVELEMAEMVDYERLRNELTIALEPVRELETP